MSACYWLWQEMRETQNNFGISKVEEREENEQTGTTSKHVHNKCDTRLKVQQYRSICLTSTQTLSSLLWVTLPKSDPVALFVPFIITSSNYKWHHKYAHHNSPELSQIIVFMTIWTHTVTWFRDINQNIDAETFK